MNFLPKYPIEKRVSWDSIVPRRRTKAAPIGVAVPAVAVAALALAVVAVGALAIGSLASLAGEAHDALRRNLGGGVPAVEVRAATAVYGGILKGHEQLVAAKELDEVQRQLLELQAAQQQASEGKAHDQ